MARRQSTRAGFLPGRNIFCLPRVFRQVGGFNESLTTAEDKDFCLRAAAAGYESIMPLEPLTVHLGYEKTLGEFLRKEYWRQSYTLPMAREEGYSLRSLRNPAVSAWHLALLVLTPPLLAAGAAAGPWALLCWLLPTLAYTTRFVGGPAALPDLCGLAFLSFLRWNAAAVALAVQLLVRR
jgi:GT2 family glycosyltransferase